MTVVRALLAVERMRTVHDGGPNGLVFLARGPSGVGLYEAVAVYDCGVVLRHGGVGWGWDAFAAARVLGGGALDGLGGLDEDAGVADGAVVPCLSLVPLRCDGGLLGSSHWLGHGVLHAR